MLKKLQQRFIFVATGSFGVVMLAILIGINAASFLRIRQMQDERLQGICEYDRMVTRESGHARPPINEMPWAGTKPGKEFVMRFFIVHSDLDGHIRVFGNEYISSVDESAAEEYTGKVLAQGREKGYCGDYRYLSLNETGENSGRTIAFLNISEDIRYLKTLFFVSALTGILSLGAVLVLVIFFSRKAIRPYARNIELQKRFITDAGHELKTPITSIATSADIAAMLYEDDEWIENIRRQSARLSKLVNDLVTLSRLDEEVPFPEKTVFSLSDAAWEIADSFTVRAKAEEKTFETDLADGLFVCGDRTSVQQMLSLLLDNALKYTPAHGSIRFSAKKEKNRIRIEMANTCELRRDEDLDRLFDRFYRPDGSRSTATGGSGLGLSIVRSIAQSHGGETAVSFADEKTILFRITLPSARG